MPYTQSLVVFPNRYCNSWHWLTCRYAYVITCKELRKEGDQVTEVHVEGRKVQEGEKPPKVSHPQAMIMFICTRPVGLQNTSDILGIVWSAGTSRREASKGQSLSGNDHVCLHKTCLHAKDILHPSPRLCVVYQNIKWVLPSLNDIKLAQSQSKTLQV